ncbi:MAG: TetR/AcrR family transcriptional regulator [Pseudomonadota bacterium]
MPRSRSQTKEQIVTAAMHQFWQHGFCSTSMDDLVRQIGTSRHAIYSDCGGKTELFIDCLKAYQYLVVSPAFEQVEAPDAGFDQVENYFNFQIERARESGWPFPGCLVANTAAESGSHDEKVLAAIESHNARLKGGFLNALQNSVGRPKHSKELDLDQLAGFLAVSTQGLWLFSRTARTMEPVRQHARTLVCIVKERIENESYSNP